MEQLDGRVAVITGAASGIGFALARRCAEAGMSVVLADVDADALPDAAARVGGLGVVTDVASAASVDALAAAALDAFGAVHLVVNNAGVSGTFARTWVTSTEEWQWVFDVNVLGVVNGIRAFVPILLGQDEGGHVVSTGSAASFEALPGMAAYAASKHAVLGLSEALRREMDAAGGKVGVSVYIPGVNISTRILDSPRTWPVDRFGPAPALDDDVLPTLIREGFRNVFAGGADPYDTIGALLDGVRANRFLISDDADLLAQWGQHPADLARGDAPAWPPR